MSSSDPSSNPDGLLRGLVSNLLSWNNRSAELHLAPMRQRVTEAEVRLEIRASVTLLKMNTSPVLPRRVQKCRDVARERAAVLRRQREADADGSDALENLENRWSAAARDAAAVVQDKVDQLQLVQDFWRQNLKAKTTLESLAAELDVSRL